MTRFAIIPLFGDRVAPRCNCTDDFLLVRIQKEGILSQEKIHLNCEEEGEWIDSLIDIGIDIFVCGGIEREHNRRLEASGIQVISNVAGGLEEVLPALAENRLEPWFGYKHIAPPANLAAITPQIQDTVTSTGTAPCLVNCMQCDERSCLAGKGCVAFTDFEPVNPWNSAHKSTYNFYLTSLAGAPISRMEDINQYCRSLHCSRLGIVFCTAVFSDIEWIQNLIDDSIQILPVCCQFGCRRDNESRDFNQKQCDPDTLVSILNDANCELIVTIGPCAQFNTALDRNSSAPVITTIVKDRQAGGNLFPVAEDCEERTNWRKERAC